MSRRLSSLLPTEPAWENVNRRHLSKSQRAMAVAKAFPDPAKLRRSGSSFAAKGQDVSQASISKARTVIRRRPVEGDGREWGAGMNLVAKSEDLVDVATVEQQIEAIAVDIEITLQVAVRRAGEKLSEAHELFVYSRNVGGFEKWVKDRIGITPQHARRLMSVYKSIPAEMSNQLVRLSNSALFETASAEPDVKAIIAERVAAGEVFTAAQVKELKAKAARSAMVPITPLSEREREQGAGLARSADP